jgi:hypothetical protein
MKSIRRPSILLLFVAVTVFPVTALLCGHRAVECKSRQGRKRKSFVQK